MLISAYAAPGAGERLVPTSIRRRNVGPNDVLIHIKYAGICHTDIHVAAGEWGPQPFPLVPGHEIVGVVAAVGSRVSTHRVGHRVGVGCFVDSCRTCANCTSGHEQHCLQGNTSTYAGVERDGTTTQGGYSTHIVVDADYVLSVPDGLSSAHAAPLLCAGITTYAPLRKWDAGPGKRVAVVGLGGLGHMAVKIAAALGAEVTVLSRSIEKHDDALALGADRFYATSDPGTFRALSDRFDLVLNTASAALDVDAYLGLLALDGVLVNLGAPREPVQLSIPALLRGGRSYAGSKIGGIAQTQEMLHFCAAHDLSAEVEIINADQINQAYQRVTDADVRYRFVIDTSTLR